jgi:hypothetical protein
MRSHKAVSGVTLVFAQISVAYGANPYYALPTRLGTGEELPEAVRLLKRVESPLEPVNPHAC